jgi:hypothetical protein
MNGEPSIPDLVAYALFDLDPQVDAAQRPLHSFLVSLVLFDAQNGLADGQIHGEVVALLPLDPPSVSEDDVMTAIELHLRHDLVQRDETGRLHLSADRRSQLEAARTRLAAKRQAFHSHMLSAVQAKAPDLSTEEQERLFERLENQLVELLQVQSSTVAAAWSSGGLGFDAGIPEVNAREHLTEIANAMAPGGAGPNKLRRAAIALGLETGLTELPNDAASYLAALYQRTVAMALLQQDPTVRHVKSQLAARRIAYLDANVVLAAMFDADQEHDVAVQALDVTLALGAELRVTSFTVAELAKRIGDASRWVRQYQGPKNLLDVVDDVIVRSYHRATRESEGLLWSAFIGGFDPPNAWLQEQSISIDTDRCRETQEDKRIVDVRSALGQNRRHASTNVLETDALNIIHVARRRQEVPADEMGNRVWLVTLDRSLGKGERSLVDDGVLLAGVSRLAANWVDILSPCLPPDEDRLSGYVAHLVQSQFSLLAEDPIFVEKQFLLTLERSRFKIEQVLGASSERARQILIRLQQDRELEELLGDPHRDETNWSDQLDAAVRRALEDLEQSPETLAELNRQRTAVEEAEQRAEREHRERLESVRALAEARATAKILRDESEKTRLERDELAEHLETVRSAPWWRRIFGRI